MKIRNLPKEFVLPIKFDSNNIDNPFLFETNDSQFKQFNVFQTVVKQQLLEEIHKIDFYLNKENNDKTFKLSMNTLFKGKDIYIKEVGTDVYKLCHAVLDKFERILNKNK